MSRKTIILPKERRARSGSPWLFSNEIRMDPSVKAIAAGAIVNVRGEDGRGFGTGYFNPKSLIAVRLLAEDCDTVIDKDFFAARLARALRLRDGLYGRPFYRLVHAEGDHLPGLVVDRFGDTLTVQLGTAGMEKQRDAGVAKRSPWRGRSRPISPPSSPACGGTVSQNRTLVF